jgi:hypothetical protein
MLYRMLTIAICFLFFHSGTIGQSGYFVGTSSVSLEPDSSIFSLALGGYGAPAEGRFTITWQLLGNAPDIKSITALNGHLYALNTKNELLRGRLSQQDVSWEPFAADQNISVLTGLNGKLYSINNKKELLAGEPAKDILRWKKLGSFDEHMIALAGLNGKLYAVNNTGELLERNLTAKGSWKKIDDTKNIGGLASDGKRLYSVNTDNTIWYCKMPGSGAQWLKIGRHNGFTYKINVRQLTVLNNRLFALADDGKLYKAAHSSKGDLSARAIAVQQGRNVVVIVGVDLVSFNYSLITGIKNTIYQKRNIAPEAIFINASHTHFAPTMKEALTYGEPMQLPDSNYLNNVVKEGIVKAIEDALNNLSPSELFFTRGSTNIGFNRSSPDPKSPYDNSLDVVKVVSADKKNRSLLFLTGCHPVARNVGVEAFTISANYPGVTRALLENSGLYKFSMFIQGCGGDINPRDQDHEKTGIALAFDIMSALAYEMKPISGDISYHLDTIDIPITPWSREEIEKFRLENIGKENLESVKNVRWANIMQRRYQDGNMPSTWPVYVQTLNIGNWKLVGLSREAVTEYGIAIKRLWPDKFVSVAGYTNDVPSYLPKERHIIAKTYEGYNSFFWNAQPAIPPVDLFNMVVLKIKEQNR